MTKHYHLIGIGGIGMGTLASLLMAMLVGTGMNCPGMSESAPDASVDPPGDTAYPCPPASLGSLA